MRLAHSPLRLVALLLALACAGRVLAQGTQGALPDPITTPDLMRYADRLGLSNDQRRAAERLHDEYREEFRVLREGEIASFMESMRGMQGRMPQRRTLEDFMRQWERLYGRIAQVDDRLFQRMQEILTEQQLAILPRVRMARERERYSGGLQEMMEMGSPIIDLTTILDVLDMHPAERAAIDPALAAYEHRLTAALRDAHKSMNRMILDMFDALEKAGITEETMQDPEQMGEMMEVMEGVMRDMFARAMARAKEMQEINEGAFRTMRQGLSEETGRAFRNLFYSQAYSGVDYALRLPVEAKLQTAISLEQISEPLRDSLHEMLAQTRFRADRVLDDAIKLHKEQQEQFTPFSSGEDFDLESHHRRANELRTAAGDIDRETTQRMLAMLAEEVDEGAREKVAEAVHEQAAPRGSRNAYAAMVAPPPADPDDEERTARSPHDQHLPAAITRREVTIYARLLDLDEARLAILDELHAAYAERFESEMEGKFKALTEARTAMWQGTADAAAADRLHRLRREALAAILAADDAFFEDVALAVLRNDDEHDRLERARLARQREVYSARSPYSYSMFGRSSHSIARIDLSRLVRLASLPQQELERIEDVLFEYEFEVAEALRDQFDAALAMTEAQEKWQLEMRRAQQEGESQYVQAMNWQDVIREPQRRISDASQRVSDLNEQTVAELLAVLRPNSAAKLDEAYRRRAFPTVYNDSAAMDKHLTAALRLPDLSEQQRMQLAELVGEYRPAYVNFSEQMVAIVRGAESDAAYADFKPEDWQRQMDLMEKMERLRFERNELNARAISRVRSILNETQLTALGPLPQPVENTGGMWGF